MRLVYFKKKALSKNFRPRNRLTCWLTNGELFLASKCALQYSHYLVSYNKIIKIQQKTYIKLIPGLVIFFKYIIALEQIWKQ